MGVIFGGSGNYYTTTTLPAASAPLTIAAWLKSNNPASYHIAFGLNDNTSYEDFSIWQRGSGASNVMSFNFMGATNVDGIAPTSGAWFPVLLQVDSSPSTSYGWQSGTKYGPSGGSFGANTVENWQISGSTSDLGARIAQWQSGCAIAEVACWSVKLDDAECAAFCDGVSPLLIRPASLNSYLRMIRHQSTPIDLIAGAVQSTTGSPTSTDHPPVIYPSRQAMILPPVKGPSLFVVQAAAPW